MNRKVNGFIFTWFLLFLASLIISPKISIIIYLLIFLLPIIIKNKKDRIITVIFLSISTPLNGNIVNIFNIKGINILEIMVLFIFFISLIKYLLKYKGIKRGFTFIDKIVGVYLIINIIPLLKGIRFYGQSAIEFKFVLIPILLYFTLKMMEINIRVKEVYNIIFNAVALYSFILLIIYFSLDLNTINLIDYEGRFSVNVTMYIFTIVYGVYSLLKEKASVKRKLYIFAVLSLELYIYSLNISRTILILIVLSLLIIYIISFNDTERNKKINISINLFFLVIIFIGSVFIYIYMQDIIEPLINRIMDVINRSGTYGNFMVRTGTTQYYIPIILKSLFGAGWGATMTIIHPQGYIILNQGFIDNYFTTLGYKAGLITVIIYFILIINSYLNIIRCTIKNKRENKLFLVSMPFLIIATNYVSAQAYHTLTTSVSIWIIFYIYSKKDMANY